MDMFTNINALLEQGAESSKVPGMSYLYADELSVYKSICTYISVKTAPSALLWLVGTVYDL